MAQEVMIPQESKRLLGCLLGCASRLDDLALALGARAHRLPPLGHLLEDRRIRVGGVSPAAFQTTSDRFDVRLAVEQDTGDSPLCSQVEERAALRLPAEAR